MRDVGRPGSTRRSSTSFANRCLQVALDESTAEVANKKIRGQSHFPTSSERSMMEKIESSC